MVVDHRAILEPRGKHRLARRHIVREPTPFLDRQRGLLAKHLFARRQRHLRHRHVPMIRRRNHRHVDIRPREHRAKIRDHRAARPAVFFIHELARLLASTPKHIAHRHDPAVVLLQKRFQIHPDAVRPEPDATERDLIRGRLRSEQPRGNNLRCDTGREDAGQTGFEKRATGGNGRFHRGVSAPTMRPPPPRSSRHLPQLPQNPRSHPRPSPLISAALITPLPP
jgi:hypothetical protein